MDPNTRALMMGAAGGGPVGPATYVEDVFQTWLHTGNNSTLSVANGIDLSTKGGMVWLKSRSAIGNNFVCDTARGVSKLLLTNTSDPNDNVPSTSNGFASFDTNGFTLAANYSGTNVSGTTYTSWTFRKQAKFFDVVTWVGNGSNQTISHSLGSVPGVIIAKRTDTAGDWYVYHRSLTTASQNFLVLNSTAAANGSVGADIWAPTSTTFKASTTLALSNSSSTYVAYLFAHDAGGFGASGNDSVVKCGSYTGNGSTSGPTIDLGWEPQWVLIKNTSTTGAWWSIFDNMRGMVVSSGASDDAHLRPDSASAETLVNAISPTSTGFTLTSNSGDYNELNSLFIYIAIRRGPMKTPTDATKVFATSAYTGNGGTNRVISGVGFPGDLMFGHKRSATGAPAWYDRLRGKAQYLQSNSAGAEGNTGPVDEGLLGQDSFTVDDSYGQFNNNTATYIMWLMRRAPGFFDVVAYTGTGANLTVSHNLGVTPELMIVKSRSAGNWNVYTASTGATKYLNLNGTIAATVSNGRWNDTAPTSTTFTAGTTLSALSENFIAYLFATLTGVSKVGSYTGTGTTLSIDCGFTNGARFVLIKRTDSTGDWYVWDTARGIIAANDPFLLLNSTAAEDTSTDYIDPLSSGFQISSTAPAAINANGGSFIYLAIA